MQHQQSKGSMEADRLMVEFISNPNFPKALARIKRAAAENDDEFLAGLANDPGERLKAQQGPSFHLGGTPKNPVSLRQSLLYHMSGV